MMSFSVHVNLKKIQQNVEKLKYFAAKNNRSLIGVTKGISGNARIANAFISGGLTTLADSRLQNIRQLINGGIKAEFVLIRPPVESELTALPHLVAISYHCETRMIDALGQRLINQHCKKHGIVLLLDLETGREGFVANEIDQAIRTAQSYSSLYLHGVAVYFGKRVTIQEMIKVQEQLVSLAKRIRQHHRIPLPMVSVGSSLAIGEAWRNGVIVEGITELRVGTAALLGMASSVGPDYLNGLSHQTMYLLAEVISTRKKHDHIQFIVSIGHLDVDPSHLILPEGLKIVDAYSDHLILRVDLQKYPRLTKQIRFDLDYYGMSRILQSPYARLIYEGEDRG